MWIISFKDKKLIEFNHLESMKNVVELRTCTAIDDWVPVWNIDSLQNYFRLSKKYITDYPIVLIEDTMFRLKKDKMFG